MKTMLTIQTRAYPVTFKDERSGGVSHDIIVLDKTRLQAAQMVGQSDKELIYRIYNRAGYRVLYIGAPDRKEIKVNLEELHRFHSEVVRYDTE